MKYCTNCGEKIDSTKKFCPNCGEKIDNIVEKNNEQDIEKIKEEHEKEDTEEKAEIKEEKKEEKKTTFGDIVRYVLGGLFCFLSVSVFINGFIIDGLLLILIGVSCFPFVYRKYLSKAIQNKFLFKSIQIFLPIFIFFIMVIIRPGSGDTIIRETTKERAQRIVENNINSKSTVIDSIIENKEIGNNDVFIKYTSTYKEGNNPLNECVDELSNLAQKVAGEKSIGTIQYECQNSNNETINHIAVENINSIESKQVKEHIIFYDANYNKIDMNVEKLKIAVTNEYKSSCKEINYKDALRNPDDLYLTRAYWFGKILQVTYNGESLTEFRVGVNCEKFYTIDDYYCDDTIYVYYDGTGRFIEDDMVKMWGYMAGTETYTTVLGASVTIPKFNAKYMELQ